MAARLGRRAHVGGLQRDDGDFARLVRARDAAVPRGEPHIGHLKNYTIGDAVAHFHRRTGRRVLHPMGYDAFGLPAENHAIKTGQHPRDSTRRRSRSSSAAVPPWGISIDWTREFGTHEPRYYRWTQWIFLQLFERGLAYRKEAAVKWCPNDQTVLANEQVIDGRCERCGTEVEVRQLEQWFFRITDYAERLLDDLDDDRVARARQDDAAQLDRALRGRRGRRSAARSSASTTRSSRRGPTRCSARRSSSWRPSIPTSCGWPRAPSTRRRSASTSTTRVGESARSAATPSARRPACRWAARVINPVNGEQIPMYVADYVLMEYGTGAIMAVPAHDQRDYDFATKFELPIRQVVAPADGREAEDDGRSSRTPRARRSSTPATSPA